MQIHWNLSTFTNIGSNMDYCLPFEKLNKNSVNIAGGKGAQLAEIFNEGIAVPEGFVVLTNCFDLFIQENNLKGKISENMKKVDVKKNETVENASKNIRKLIESSEIPEEAEKSIKKEFEKLNAKFVAVRSSATAEDASSASWAGELESYLNVQEENILESVKKCWGSLFTPRAIFYRIEKNLQNQSISVAVVIQKMVNSDVSGVAFTIHPVTKERNKIIIEAGFGLGEAIVQGMITPDSYIIDKNEMLILELTINKQEKKIVKKVLKGKVKTEVEKVPLKDQETQKLDGKKIIELAKISLDIEKHYNAAQDIEFAIENGKIYIVQTRPVTAL